MDDTTNTMSLDQHRTTNGDTGLNMLLDFDSVGGYAEGECFIYCSIPDLNNSDNKESWIANYVVTESP
jgi:hypothetical protein